VRALFVCAACNATSANRWLLDAFAAIAGDRVEPTWEQSVAVLPAFNPDLSDDAPAEVRGLRRRVADADAIVFCVPEYAASVPGMLKNALDWLVGSGELYEKPVTVHEHRYHGRPARVAGDGAHARVPWRRRRGHARRRRATGQVLGRRIARRRADASSDRRAGRRDDQRGATNEIVRFLPEASVSSGGTRNPAGGEVSIPSGS